MENTHAAEHHPVPDRTQLNVFVWLIFLTAVTVTGSVLFPGRTGTTVAVIVTPIKAALILMYFMHLKYERPIFVVMFFVAISILATVLGLTLVDYLYR